jgi:hypothetical protein
VRVRERTREGEKNGGGKFEFLDLINHKNVLKLYLCGLVFYWSF